MEPSAKSQNQVGYQSRQMMNLNLSVEANDFVRSLVAQGRYQSEEDAVIDGIRLLKGREELRTKIAAGIGQLDSGESFDEDAVFNEVEAEIRRSESLGNPG